MKIDRYPAIKAAAKALFQVKGYNAVTMRDIAGEVGIGVNVIYRNTPSKSALLGDIFRDYFKEALKRIYDLQQPRGSKVDIIMAYLQELYTMDIEILDLRRLGVEASWCWEVSQEKEFEMLVGLELFKPINNALSEKGMYLDEYTRWAIWAIYTEGLRRSGIEMRAFKDQQNQVKKQFIERVRKQVSLVIASG